MKRKYFFILLLNLAMVGGCSKFLDEKPDKSLVVPSTLKDLQAILNNAIIFNAGYTYAVEIGSDDYYITTADWLARNTWEQNAHVWSAETFNDNTDQWSSPYSIVYNANVVLDQLAIHGSSIGTQQDINNIRGQALFFRSFAFYNLLQAFAKPYSDSAGSQVGIALRLDADLNKPTKRATLKESYDQLIADAKQAITILPDVQSLKTRPTRAAAYALLARTFLSMSDYANAVLYADSALQLNNTLLDYNTLNPTAARPVPQFNSECIFHATFFTSNSVNLLSKADSILFQSYTANDLRKQIFYKNNGDGTFSFKGSYDASVRTFYGFATDEMYLTRAECNARMGNTAAAMNDLNTLLVKRWKTGTFIPYTAIDPADALQKILSERRKELTMRGLRWPDLRRLNKDPQFAKTLKRVLANKEYYLYPNSPRYTYPIPALIIQMTGIPQNE